MSFKNDRNCEVRFIGKEAINPIVRTAANVPRPSVLREMQQRASTVDNPNGRQMQQESRVPLSTKPIKKLLQPRKITMPMSSERSNSKSSLRNDSIERYFLATPRTAQDTGHGNNNSSTVQPNSRQY